MRILRHLALGALPFLTSAALAADFDGSKPLICSTISAVDCMRGLECLPGLPEDIGAPAFMRLDFAKKAVVGPKSTSPILLQEKTSTQMLLQGREGSYAWTMAIEADSGELTLTFVSRATAYVLFGNCTPL